MGHRQPILQLTDKTPELKLKAVFSKPKKQGGWLRLIKDYGILFGYLDEQVFGKLGIRTKGNAHRDIYPRDGIGKGPVDQPTCDEFLVGDDWGVWRGQRQVEEESLSLSVAAWWRM